MYLFIVFFCLLCLVSHIQGFVSMGASRVLSKVIAKTKPTYPSRTLHKYTHHDKFMKISTKLQASKVEELGESLRKYDIPNKLTMARIIAIPAFMTAFLNHYRATAFFLFLFACLTDFVDGYLARKWKQTSALGAFLDPVADKLMVSTALILIALDIPLPVYVLPVACILAREIGVSALREWMASRGHREVVKVGRMGKVKTTLQMIATGLLLFAAPGYTVDIDLCDWIILPKLYVVLAGVSVLYLSMLATLYSGFEYFRAAVPFLCPLGCSKQLHQSNELDEEVLSGGSDSTTTTTTTTTVVSVGDGVTTSPTDSSVGTNTDSSCSSSSSTDSDCDCDTAATTTTTSSSI